MSDWLTEANYLIMIIQVLVTLLIVPVFSYRLLLNVANDYGVTRFPKASAEVKLWLNKANRRYWSLVAVSFCICGFVVVHAMVNKSELFNWDDQSGLMVMYLLSMIPVITMVIMHRSLFAIFKRYAGNKRTASLRVKCWRDYISLPLIFLVVLANITFIATVMYFIQHPFEGFAGVGNLIGLLVINCLFGGIIFAVYRDNKTNAIQIPEQRDALKKRSININLLILVIALFHLSLSMWVQGTELVIYKLMIQSLYFQVILVITAFSLTLPKSIFSQEN